MASISSIPTEIFEQFIDELKLHYRSTLELASVSKRWYCPVMTRILKEICVFNQENVEGYIKLLESNSKLANMIEKITVYGEENSEMARVGIEEIALPSITKLLKLLPNLKTLDGYCPVFLTTTIGRTRSTQFLTLTTVTHLDLEFEILPGQNANSIDQIVERIPHLVDMGIEIFGVYDAKSTSTLMTSNIPIKTFSVFGQNKTPGAITTLDFQFFADNILSRFPLQSFVGLTSLKLFCGSSVESIIEVIRLAGPTLATLVLLDNVIEYQYKDIATLFPYLQQLKSFSIEKITFLPDNFLQQIPASITSLRVGDSLQARHFQHLESHPRPEFKLRQLYNDALTEASCYTFLPLSLREVVMSGIFDLVTLYKALLDRRVVGEVLKLKYYGIESEKDAEWIKKFADIGVNLC